MLGCDQSEKDFQALFRGERTVILPIRLLGLGKGVKYAADLFHPASISCCQRDARNYFGLRAHGRQAGTHNRINLCAGKNAVKLNFPEAGAVDPPGGSHPRTRQMEGTGALIEEHGVTLTACARQH